MGRELVGIAALTVVLCLSTRCGTGAINTCDDTVAPGVACSDPKLCCDWPNTECGGCQCNGTSFVCDMGACSPMAQCPLASTLVSGDECGHPAGAPICAFYPPSPSSCPSTAEIYPCGATCSCSGSANVFSQVSGTWSCTANACVDAAAEAGDAGSD